MLFTQIIVCIFVALPNIGFKNLKTNNKEKTMRATTTFSQKVKLIIFAALFISQISWAYEVVKYALTTNTLSTSADIPANANMNFTTTAHSSDGSTPNTISFAGNFGITSKWDAANGGSKSWQTAPFTTIGYHTIGVSANMKSDNNAGPRDFALEYSINNGANWVLVNNFTVSSSSLAKTANLPEACQNKASVILRWRNTSNFAAGTGFTTATGKCYMKTVTIDGLLPVIPSTQANNITIVSRTPTTITVGWTKGTQADNVLVMMNTENSFTPLPSNDETFTAITGTYTSGRQTIYVGSGTSVTVDVPSATENYYFRVFDFQPNNGLERYITTSSDTPPFTVVLNPSLCALENVTLNPPTIRLTRATLAATVAGPKKSSISERTIYWDYNPGVNENTGNQLVSYTDEIGTYSFPNVDIGRGVTIYYIASVTNESGTIWSAEASFNNTPVFTGTNNWSSASNWNVQEVPGINGDATYGSIDDNPIIQGNCTLSSSNSVNNLSIGASGKLTVNTGTTMNVVGTLTNNNGSNGILIKSDKGLRNGSLIWSDGNPQGTVEMFSKSYTDTQYHWQYFGIPVTGMNAASTFSGAGVRVRKFYEPNIDPTGQDNGLWLPSIPGGSMSTLNEAMFPVEGYEVTQRSENKFIFSGTLNHNNIVNYPLSYTPSADWKGSNIIANPFTAAINIASISSTNTDGNVYLYNSGSRDEWTANNGELVDGQSPGQYTASNGAFAGTLGVPTQIPSLQGFLVMATNVGATISIPYNSVTPNSTLQRAPKQKTAIVGTSIELIGSKGADKMWIFSDNTYSRNNNIGLDAKKMIGSLSVPQIFASETDGDYQIDAVDDMNNTYLGFQPGNETDLKLVFHHQNNTNKYNKVYLVDMATNTTTDITQTGSEYEFSASPSSLSTNRFKLITTPASITSVKEISEESNLNIFSSKHNIQIQNKSDKIGEVLIYNLAGVLIIKDIIKPSGFTTISKINSGVYIIKASTEIEKVNQRIIIQ